MLPQGAGVNPTVCLSVCPCAGTGTCGGTPPLWSSTSPPPLPCPCPPSARHASTSLALPLPFGCRSTCAVQDGGAIEQALQHVNQVLDKRNPMALDFQDGSGVVALEVEWVHIVGIDYKCPLHEDARLVLEVKRMTKRSFHTVGASSWRAGRGTLLALAVGLLLLPVPLGCACLVDGSPAGRWVGERAAAGQHTS